MTNRILPPPVAATESILPFSQKKKVRAEIMTAPTTKQELSTFVLKSGLLVAGRSTSFPPLVLASAYSAPLVASCGIRSPISQNSASMRALSSSARVENGIKGPVSCFRQKRVVRTRLLAVNASDNLCMVECCITGSTASIRNDVGGSVGYTFKATSVYFDVGDANADDD